LSEYTTEEILKLIEENGGSEGLDLSRKELSGIDLSRGTIQMEWAKVREEDPAARPLWVSEWTKGINLKGANLREAALIGAKLQGAHLERAELQEANLTQAILLNANLQEANLWGANLRGASLGGAFLEAAQLREADLQEAYLLETNLEGANLREADLRQVDLGGVMSLRGAFFYRARLDHTEMDQSLLGPAIGEELAENLRHRYNWARGAYLRLKQNFDDLGDYDAASWAYRKERRMEKLEARQKAQRARTERKWQAAVTNYAKFAGDQLVEWICDYGESVQRVLCSLLMVYVLFTLTYGLTWSVIRVHATPTAIIKEPTRNLVDLARFSLGAMTTMDLTGLEPRNGLVELLAGLEALLGVALTGLLGFVAGNRVRRS